MQVVPSARISRSPILGFVQIILLIKWCSYLIQKSTVQSPEEPLHYRREVRLKPFHLTWRNHKVSNSVRLQCTYHIPRTLYPQRGRREISDIPRDAHVLLKRLSCEKYCRRDRRQAHRRIIAVYPRCEHR
jgi:hypothetical protein